MRGLVVGLGSIGKRHVRNLRQLVPDADITVLRHRKDDRQEIEAGVNRVVYNLQDAIRENPQFAVVASPAPFHIENALQLAKHGVHLLLEKPISNRLDGVDELIAVCEAKKISLLVGYTLRFSHSLRTLRNAVGEGRIGRVLGLHSEVGQYLPDWRKNSSYRATVTAHRSLGGGVLLELSHEIDNARWIVGDIVEVSAITGRLSDLDIDVEDWADLNVRFSCGAIGHIHLDMVQRAPTRGCRVVGSDGTITWEAQTNHVRWFSAASQEWKDLHPAGTRDNNEMYLDELDHFLDCVRGNAEPAVTGRDGKRALEIALAANESALRHMTVSL